MTLAKAIATRIDELLKETQMTQYRLSKLSGISQSTISDIRHCKISPSMIILYTIILSFEIDFIQFFDTALFLRDNLSDTLCPTELSQAHTNL